MSGIQDSQADIATAGFAARLIASADEKGWKQAELSRRSGVDRKRISEYWRGKQRPSRENLFALADALEVDPRWLSGGAGESASHALAEIDALIEEGEDSAVYARRDELEGIAFDADLPAGIRNRADYILAAMGDPAAKQRRRKFAKDYRALRDNIAVIVDAALDDVAASRGVKLGESVRKPMHALCNYLLHSTADGDLAGLLNWLVTSVATGFLDSGAPPQGENGL